MLLYSSKNFDAVYIGGLEQKMQYLIMCRSLTSAQKSSALLERKGISASVIKAPQGLSTKGCGYALSLYKNFDEASILLKRNKLLNGKRFKLFEGGDYMEVFDDLS